MGWGTSFKTEIYLSKQIFSNVFELENKIEENEKSIEDAKKRIQMFVSASPRDIIDPEWKEQPIDWLVNSTEGWFEAIQDAIGENIRLNLYLDYINEESGGKIPERKLENFSSVNYGDDGIGLTSEQITDLL